VMPEALHLSQVGYAPPRDRSGIAASESRVQDH